MTTVLVTKDILSERLCQQTKLNELTRNTMKYIKDAGFGNNEDNHPANLLLKKEINWSWIFHPNIKC